MKIDTKARTITFFSSEKVRPDTLRQAVEMLSTGEGEFTIFADIDLPQWEMDLLMSSFTPVVTQVPSFTKPGTVYQVIEIRKGLFTCSCPDFTKRRVFNGGECKHVFSVRMPF
jgi:hypothetical protein